MLEIKVPSCTAQTFEKNLHELSLLCLKFQQRTCAVIALMKYATFLNVKTSNLLFYPIKYIIIINVRKYVSL